MNYGISFIPIIAAAHFDKAILKITSRLPYFEHVFTDVKGMDTARGIIDGSIVLQKNHVWLNLLVPVLLVLIMAAEVWLSFRVVNKLNSKPGSTVSSKVFYLIPIVYGGIFLTMLIVWRWF